MSQQVAAAGREQENKDTLRRLYAEFVDRGDARILDQIIAPDFVSEAAPAVKGAEAVKAIVLPVRAAFPDLHHTILDLVAEGDLVAVRWTMKGTHRGPFSGMPATGKPVAFNAISIYRFRDGKIAELWAQVDRLGLLQQLGAVPQPAPAGATRA
jgi:steroid delta-isomerase-like uncharacterized protein